MPAATANVKEQALSLIAELQAWGPDIAALEAWKANRKAHEVELVSLQGQVAGLRADRAEAVRSQRFEQQLDPPVKVTPSARTQWVDPKPFPYLEKGSHMDQIVDGIVEKFAGKQNG